MFGWFVTRPVVTPSFERWCDLVFAWFAERDGRERTAAIPMYRPTIEDFPADGRQGHDLALHWFAQVKERCGMADWPCRLEPQGQACGEMPCWVPYDQSSQGAAGTFRMAPDATVITYDPALLRQPVALIATFAHELSHWLLAPEVALIPGGAVRHEEATDLMAVHLGWGLFQLRSTRQFVQTCCGFGVSGGGYLSRAQSAHALALFCRRQGIAVGACSEHLDGEAWRLVKRAGRWLERREGAA